MARELTIDEFNNEFGRNSYHYPVYKMVSEEDLDTFVAMVPDGQTIPYFCKWYQEDSEEKITKLDRELEIIKIIKG